MVFVRQIITIIRVLRHEHAIGYVMSSILRYIV